MQIHSSAGSPKFSQARLRQFAALLLGMGLRQFSVPPHNIPEIKRVIRATTLADAKEVAAKALQLETATEVTNYLRDQTRRVLPGYEI